MSKADKIVESTVNLVTVIIKGLIASDEPELARELIEATRIACDEGTDLVNRYTLSKFK